MSIEWISVSTRVPCDRRNVLVWVRPSGPMSFILKGHASISKYNACSNGGQFDCERGYFVLGHSVVSHWSDDIQEGPPDIVVLQPPSKP